VLGTFEIGSHKLIRPPQTVVLLFLRSKDYRRESPAPGMSVKFRVGSCCHNSSIRTLSGIVIFLLSFLHSSLRHLTLITSFSRCKNTALTLSFQLWSHKHNSSNSSFVEEAQMILVGL
jgi:hypothetical protein